ncbi:cell wall-binding repeat-containing protein [Kitasatospora sp. NPDC056783]|uniref:cell wall-binding repeat-containing protein n=1 Tax=Kitasatospora sp. NPDC056783 TaxID=3345943 RepID=UPI0036ADCB45
MGQTPEDRSAIQQIAAAGAGGERKLAYRAHVRNIGWGPWAGASSDGFAGWTGRGEPIEAVEFAWAAAQPEAVLDVRSHWSGVGWEGAARVPSAATGQKLVIGTSGIAGPTLESLVFGGDNANYYKADGHVKDIGWQSLDYRSVVRQEVGTTGRALWMEAFRVVPMPGYTEPVGLSRVSGASAFETSVNASKKYWRNRGVAGGNSAESAVVARADAWHDPVSAIPLAKAKRGPLLLNPQDGLDAGVAAELQRVLPAGRTVYLPGGTSSISDRTEQQIRALGYNTQRFLGTNAAQVSLSIARDGIGSPKHVTIVNVDSWQEAFSASTAVAAVDGAMVYSFGSGVEPAIKAWLDSLPAAVTKTTVGASSAGAYPSTSGGVQGANDVETNALVADRFIPDPDSVALVSTGSPTDAIVAGTYAAANGSPAILTSPGVLEVGPTWFTDDHSVTVKDVTVFGGTAAIPDAVAQEAKDSSTEAFAPGEVVPPGEQPKSPEELAALAITPDWAMEGAAAAGPQARALSGYPAGMNDAEGEFCKWPSRWNICLQAYDASEMAKYHADKEGQPGGYWPGSNGNGGKRDAYRHCVWSGQMALIMGSKTAKGFGDRHETGPKPPQMSDELANSHHAMDYHNNAVGRFFGQHARDHINEAHATFPEAASQMRGWCQLSVNDGDLHSLWY